MMAAEDGTKKHSQDDKDEIIQASSPRPGAVKMPAGRAKRKANKKATSGPSPSSYRVAMTNLRGLSRLKQKSAAAEASALSGLSKGITKPTGEPPEPHHVNPIDPPPRTPPGQPDNDSIPPLRPQPIRGDTGLVEAIPVDDESDISTPPDLEDAQHKENSKVSKSRTIGYVLAAMISLAVVVSVSVVVSISIVNRSAKTEFIPSRPSSQQLDDDADSGSDDISDSGSDDIKCFHYNPNHCPFWVDFRYVPSDIGTQSSITSLNLARMGFGGSLPSEIGMLSSLTYLNLRNNAFDGIVPSEIGALTSLRYLNLRSNAFNGQVPSEIGGMTSLWYLNLRGNELSGLVPSEIGSMASLKFFSLWENAFNGRVPSQIGMLTSLTYLNLWDNELTGSVPSDLCSPSNVIAIDCAELDCPCSVLTCVCA